LNDTLLDLLAIVNAGIYAASAVVAFVLHRRLRQPVSAWMAAAFSTLGVVAVAGLLPLEDLGGVLGPVVGTLLALILLAFPYLLLRFAVSLEAVTRAVVTPASAIYAALALATLVVRPFEQGDAVPGAYVAFALGYWTVLSLTAAFALWRRGRGQPRTSRRRMQALGLGALVLNGVLVGMVGVPAERVWTLLLLNGIVWAGAVLFLLGFAPPSVVRRAWRAPEERQLQAATADLIAAADLHAAMEALLPRVARLVGGWTAALLDRDGAVVAADAAWPADADRWSEQLPTAEVAVQRDLVAVPLQHGVLVVRARRFAAIFGSEELRLLTRLGALVDLAMERFMLLEQERRARTLLEQSTQELRSLLYGISHDLRNPIVSVLGYVELLQQHDRLAGDEETNGFLERIAVNARYMSALIDDLLELSRIGRVHTDREAVDLAALADDVAGELLRRHPALRMDLGSLPVVVMNPERARQLVTNLLENAVRHGGREDLTVTLGSSRNDGQGSCIWVADDGVGIPTEYRERVFEMFERLGGDGKPGTGVGLTMCRRIVEEIGGTIRVVDGDAGTRFCIDLPAAALAPEGSLKDST
jgi:signal transduction histidine kinase